MAMAVLIPKDKKKIQKKIIQLSAEIERHDRLYYKDAQPEISDFEYDCLKAELLRLESLLPEFSSTKIGDDRSGYLLTRPHLTPMLSLENTYDLADVLRFDARIRKRLKMDALTYVVEPKIDGLAVNLIYRNGRLECALTRGNGIEGDDVTDNVRTIKDLPLVIYRNGRLECALTRGNGTEGDDVTDNIRTIKDLPLILEGVPELMEIRGEVYLEQDTFQRINRERLERGETPFANARNLASGTLKLMDSDEVQARRLRLITYGVGLGNLFTRQSDIYPFLKHLGFPSQRYFTTIETIEKAEDVIRWLDEVRRQLPYDTDGVVFKVDTCALHEQLGATAKAPRWAFAYKFEPERVETILRDIVLQIGRTGVITPVAVLDPVQLSGSRVSRATLHNADDIGKKDLRIGDTVVIEKSGEIIPAIVGVKLEGRRDLPLEAFKFPQKCPCCGTVLVRLSDEVAWRCPHSNCPEQVIQSIIYFASKTAMDIDGLGERIVRQLVEKGKLKTIADVYHLDREDLSVLEHFGEKSIHRLLANIEHRKKIELWRFINALGIPFVGQKIAKDLAMHFRALDVLVNASIDDLRQISGIGDRAAQQIVDFFQNVEHVALIRRLLASGLVLSS